MGFVVAGIVMGGASLIGAGASLIGSNEQANAANNATSVQEQEFQQQQANQAPYLQAGYGALSQLSGMAGQTPNFTAQDFLNNQDPAYGFDLSQGQQAIERSAAASGAFMISSSPRRIPLSASACGSGRSTTVISSKGATGVYPCSCRCR